MKYCIFIIFFLPPFLLLGQLSITVDAINPTCASNGQITVNTSGGSGNYTYALDYDCGDLIPPQSSNVFTTLLPCTYTVNVVDNVSQESVNEQLSLSSIYEMMELSVSSVNCDLLVSVATQTGTPPFIYSYSTNGTDESSFIDNQPDDSNLFTGLPAGLIWFRVRDNCGNTRLAQTVISNSSVEDFNDQQFDDGLHITPVGGNPPYTYELTSSLGDFQNETGIFPWNEVGCSPRITITDQCSGFALSNQFVEITVSGRLDCVNFAQGTASLSANPGRAPFTFIAETSAGDFTSNDGIFTNLPPNAAFYDFYIEDACGLRKLIRYTTRFQLDFEPTFNGCSDDEISFNIERQCSGPFYPMEVTCLNCNELEPLEITASYQDIQFSGYLPGEWDLLIVDQSCGDSIRCQDELIIELTPACDSILALVVDQFNCDNGIGNRRVIYDTTATFSIHDENGLIEEGNTTGVFNNLPPGAYEVTAYLDCDTLVNFVTLSEATPIDPYFETRIRYGNYEGDSCRYNYSIQLEKTLGPFVISGGADGSYYQVLNNYGEDNCRFYTFSLAPGTYTIASMSRCGEMVLELPELPFNELGGVNVLSNCPSGSRIEIDGFLRSASAWRNLLAPYNLNIEDLDRGDRYRVDGQFYTSNTINGLSPGEHTLYLHPLHSSSLCPIDSISFFIPEYLPVQLETTGNILCDNNNQTDLTVMIANGNVPYQFSEIDCNNPSVQLFTQTVDSTSEQIVLQNRSLGIYCFVVRDGCGISSDFQEEIRYYGDDIEFTYACDSTILLSVDSINIPILWQNQNQEIIGMGASLLQAAPDVDATFSVTLELPACTIEREVLVPARTILPSLMITPSNADTFILCGEETVELILETDAIDINWNTGDNTLSLLVTETGQYLVEVTNDIGCTQVDSINVLKVPLPTPEIIAPDEFCEGDSLVLNLNQAYPTMLWSNSSVADSLIITEGGLYSISVTNEYACPQLDSVLVIKWDLPVFLLEGEQTICPNTSTLIQPDSTFVTYEWSTGENTPSINVIAGTYQITVTDEHSCENTDSISIQELPQISVQLQGDTLVCKGDEANIQFQMEGSDQTAMLIVEVQASGAQFPFQLLPNENFNLPFNSSSAVNILTIVLENYDCPIDITGQANIVVTNESSNFDTTNISCYGETDGSILTSTNSQSPPYQYIWNNGNQGEVLSNLASGTYYVTVTDSLNCTWTDSVFIANPSSITPAIFVDNPLCHNEASGLIAIDHIVGGTSPFTVFVNGDQQTNIPYENSELGYGTYQISLVDVNNCPWDTLINLINPPLLEVTLGENQEIKLGDILMLTAQPNLPNIETWQWENLSFPEYLDAISSNSIQPFETSTYHVLIKNTVGCIAEDWVTVFVDRNTGVYIPNAFSPNNDGINDYFNVFTSNSIKKINNFSIFNRWGEQVYDIDKMPLTASQPGWDGKQRDQEASVGVYVYLIEVELIDGTTRFYKGDVMLLR